MADPQRLQLPAKARGRRRQAERTAETRGRILEAVLESISEVGFQRTTAAEVTRRSGVTWGAVQHHFGGKEGLLLAVVEASFDHFTAQLADIPIDGPLEERVSWFVEGAWRHFSSASYRSTFEILLHYLGEEAARDEAPAGTSASWQLQMFGAWDTVWRRIFHDAPRSRGEHAVLEHYTVSTLSGFASMLRLEGPRAALRSGELELLKGLLLRELSRR